MCPKDAEGIANSVDPDQTAPLGAVRSGCALFAQTYLSENLGSLRYLWYKQWQYCKDPFRKDYIQQSVTLIFFLILKNYLWSLPTEAPTFSFNNFSIMSTLISLAVPGGTNL